MFKSKVSFLDSFRETLIHGRAEEIIELMRNHEDEVDNLLEFVQECQEEELAELRYEEIEEEDFQELDPFTATTERLEEFKWTKEITQEFSFKYYKKSKEVIRKELTK